MKAVLVVVFLCLGVVLAADEKEDYDVDEYSCKFGLQEALDTQIAKREDGKKMDSDATTGSRKKRQIYPNFYYPSYNSFVGNGLLRDTIYDPVNYIQRLPYLPNPYRASFSTLPIFQFFDRFYPVEIVRSNNVLVRNYVRFNTGYTDALADFRALPIFNIREITTTGVATSGADLEAAVYGYEGGSIRLLRQGCALDGIDNANFPCIYLTLPSLRFGNVVRRFSYIRGFGAGRILGSQFNKK